MWHGPPGQKSKRNWREVRNEIAEYVAGFANADGGTLVMGVEDDGTPSGHGYSPQEIDDLLATTASRLKPPLVNGVRATLEGKEVLLFNVQAAAVPVMVVGDGYPRRVDDRLHMMPESDIAAIKQQSVLGSAEARPARGISFDLLDVKLIERCAVAARIPPLRDFEADYLIQRRLADRTDSGVVLRQGAVWLFARAGVMIPHPNAGIRVFQVEGTEKRTGTTHNVREFPRIEGNLPSVLEKAKELLSTLIKRSTKLHDLFFKELPEYPTFAWQEALVNAVAHRDYGIEGRGVEVWLFADRMEVVSPGGLLPTVSIETLRNRKPVHVSRNPALTRVLTELSIMREQGEGIPRMFSEMEESWLPLPEFAAGPHVFTVTLRNTPILDAGDPAWAEAVRAMADINVRQKRILVARARARFTNADYQTINQVDRDVAYNEIRQLIEAGRIRPFGKKGRGASYEVLVTAGRGAKVAVAGSSTQKRAGGPAEFAALRDRMVANGRIVNADLREIFKIDRIRSIRMLAFMRKVAIVEARGKGPRAYYVPGGMWQSWIDDRSR